MRCIYRSRLVGHDRNTINNLMPFAAQKMILYNFCLCWVRARMNKARWVLCMEYMSPTRLSFAKIPILSPFSDPALVRRRHSDLQRSGQSFPFILYRCLSWSLVYVFSRRFLATISMISRSRRCPTNTHPILPQWLRKRLYNSFPQCRR